jgi:hypothetical protein
MMCMTLLSDDRIAHLSGSGLAMRALDAVIDDNRSGAGVEQDGANGAYGGAKEATATARRLAHCKAPIRRHRLDLSPERSASHRSARQSG